MLKNVIHNKLLPVLLLFAVLPVLLLGGYGYFSLSSTLREHNVAQQESRVTLTGERMDVFLQSVHSDLFYLRDSSAMSLYLSALKLGDENSQALMLKNLQTSLLDFSDKKGIYHQIRFIDKAGKELVSIERSTDASKIVEDSKLQNRKGSFYFDDAIGLAKDGLFVSSLDLNQEKGKVELPIRPMIRYATPVFTENNELKGLVILNVSAANLLKLISGQDNTNESMMFIDKGGFYYYHPDENKAWGGKNDLNSGSNFYKDYPELINGIENNISLASFEAGGHFISVQPVMVGNGHQKLGTLVSMSNARSVYAKSNYFALVALGLLALAIVLAVVFAKRLSNTVSSVSSKE